MYTRSRSRIVVNIMQTFMWWWELLQPKEIEEVDKYAR